jgi:hypothetical protein
MATAEVAVTKRISSSTCAHTKQKGGKANLFNGSLLRNLIPLCLVSRIPALLSFKKRLRLQLQSQSQAQASTAAPQFFSIIIAWETHTCAVRLCTCIRRCPQHTLPRHCRSPLVHYTTVVRKCSLFFCLPLFLFRCVFVRYRLSSSAHKAAFQCRFAQHDTRGTFDAAFPSPRTSLWL